MSPDEVRALAPSAFAAWDAVCDAAPPIDCGTPAAAEFAEQFRIDVSAISADQRARLGAALAAETFAFVQAVYVEDQGSRLLAACRQIFGAEPSRRTPEPQAPVGLWPAIEAMLAAVIRLDALDPLTAELVRLRGANAHHCRLCMSRRDLDAVRADSGLLERVDQFEDAGFSDRQRAALRLTDAIVWQPDAIPAETIDGAQRELTPAEIVEVILDVTRNASNKIAVALGADQPAVTDGPEYFAISPTGDYTYGLTP